MKTISTFLIILLLFGCRKTHPDNTVITYKFTSDVPAKYQLDYAVSNSSTSSILYDGTSWLHNVEVSKNDQPDNFSVARLTVRSPSNWAGIADSAHINLTIRIDGDEKVNVDTVMTGADNSGITELYTF